MKKSWVVRAAVLWMLTLTMCVAGFSVGRALLSGGIWPVASGVDVRTKDSLTVDCSNDTDGYMMIHGENSKSRLKLRVSKGATTLMYDLNAEGAYESFPLQLGSGDYKVELFRNVSGTKYAQAGTLSISAELSDDSVAFLSPNQYVNYTPDSAAVALSEEICAGLTDDGEKLEAVREYFREHFSYDFHKAATIAKGTMPDMDEVLETGMGICQDLSALAACMLRVQGIPTQMVIGYVDRNYHAWNQVLIDGEYKRIDMTAEVGALPQNMTYTVERFY